MQPCRSCQLRSTAAAAKQRRTTTKLRWRRRSSGVRWGRPACSTTLLRGGMGRREGEAGDVESWIGVRFPALHSSRRAR